MNKGAAVVQLEHKTVNAAIRVGLLPTECACRCSHLQPPRQAFDANGAHQRVVGEVEARKRRVGGQQLRQSSSGLEAQLVVAEESGGRDISHRVPTWSCCVPTYLDTK